MRKLTTTVLNAGLLCLAAASPLWAQAGPGDSGQAARAGVGNQVTNQAAGIPEGEPGDTAPIPQDESDHMQQAYKDYQGKNFPKATKELQEVLKKEPNIVEAHEMLASIYMNQNQVPQAIPELETVVRLQPKNAVFRDNLGVAYLQSGDSVKAAGTFQALLTQAPTNASYAFQYAIALEKQNKHMEAAAAFEKAAILNPKDPSAPLYAGLLYHQAGNDAKAVPYLKSAVSLGTDQKFSADTALAEAASAAKNTAEAAQYYTLANQANPTDFNTEANLGILEQNAGNKADAEAAYRKAVALKTDDAKFLAGIEANLAMLLTGEGKLDDAAAYLTKATQSDPTNVSLQDSLGAVYEKQGKKDLALAAFKTALTINPNNGVAKDGVARLSK